MNFYSILTCTKYNGRVLRVPARCYNRSISDTGLGLEYLGKRKQIFKVWVDSFVSKA
jgi:hypothetical protein